MLGKQKRQGFVCLMHELHAQRLVIMNHANSHSSGRGSVSRQGLCSWMGQAKHSQANHLEGAGPWATCCNPQIRNQEPPSDLQQVPRACPPNQNSRPSPALLPPAKMSEGSNEQTLGEEIYNNRRAIPGSHGHI